MNDVKVDPIPPRKRTCERDYCTAYRHEHRDDAGEWLTCGCGKPAHHDSVVEELQHDDGSSCDTITAREWPEIVVHEFGSTGTAYNMTQTREDIRDGDVLSVPNERVVGVLVSAWPVSVTAKCGEFHGLNLSDGQQRYEAWAALDGGKYAHSYVTAVELLVIDMHEVVRILIDDYKIVAFVENSGGGCMTIYAGERKAPDEFGDERYPAIAGPGTWGGPGQHSIGNATDFYVGPDDDGATSVVSVADLGALSEREVAELMVQTVRGELVNTAPVVLYTMAPPDESVRDAYPLYYQSWDGQFDGGALYRVTWDGAQPERRNGSGVWEKSRYRAERDLRDGTGVVRVYPPTPNELID